MHPIEQPALRDVSESYLLRVQLDRLVYLWLLLADSVEKVGSPKQPGH
jgi:hypothetical protein